MTLHGTNLHSPAIQDFCSKWKIRELSVFGSVLFDSLHMEDELAELVGRSVDIIDRCAIEQGGNRFVKQQILSTAEPVYAER